jgi:hypothetical protein
MGAIGLNENPSSAGITHRAIIERQHRPMQNRILATAREPHTAERRGLYHATVASLRKKAPIGSPKQPHNTATAI